VKTCGIAEQHSSVRVKSSLHNNSSEYQTMGKSQKPIDSTEYEMRVAVSSVGKFEQLPYNLNEPDDDRLRSKHAAQH
jgi:hypothetical protein